MLILYTITGCNCIKKLKEHLKTNKIAYKEKNLYQTLLDEQGMNELLEHPLEKIINQKYLEQLEKLNKEEIKEVIRKNPIIVRRPIIIDDNLEGLNDIILRNCDQRCSSYMVCGELFK